MPRVRTPHFTTLLLAVLLGVLLISGVWGVFLINRLSSSELQERRESLRSSLLGFRAGLIETLFTDISDFQPWAQGLESAADPRQELADRFVRYRQSNDVRLVSGLALITRTESGLRLERLVEATRTFQPENWPPELSSLRSSIDGPSGSESGPSPIGFGIRLSGAQPVVVIPFGADFRRGGSIAGLARFRGPEPLAPPGLGFGPPGAPPRPAPGFPLPDNDRRLLPQPSGWCVLTLDVPTLTTRVLPALVDRHFKGREREFSLLVTSSQTGRMIFRAGPTIDGADHEAYDDAISLLEDRRRPFFERLGQGTNRGEAAAFEPAEGPQRVSSEGWILAARHRDGPVEEVVARGRRRSLALAFGLLAALGVSSVMLVWSARRTRELARRQMEFVAGVSHELLTPLSVIRTAASNLSRGVVHDSEKTAEYGRLLDKEGLRLSKMIRQVLDFAGLQADRKVGRSEEVNIAAVLRGIVAEYRPLLEQDGWELQEEIQEVGAVRADLRLIESCVTNLIDNATKYASSGKWIRLTATRESPSRVKVTVEDHGPGILAEDLPHIFEPFYRGRGLAASRLPGAGLGLSIVWRHMEAIGGKASVSCAEDGCAFTLLFPSSRVEEP